MVKIRNIFGDEYSGAAGKAGVFAKWKGRQYRRKYVIPANPKTTMQKNVRTHFTASVALWHTWSTLKKRVYSYLATGLVLSGFNLLVRRYQLWKLKAKTAVADPIEGIKQIGDGDETASGDESTFDNAGPKTSNSPVIIGSFVPGAEVTKLDADVIVNADMGDIIIPLAITDCEGHAGSEKTVATGDKMFITYKSQGRTVAREDLEIPNSEMVAGSINARATIDLALRTKYWPIDLKSVKVEIQDATDEEYYELDSVTILNTTGDVNANQTGSPHTGQNCAYKYYTALKDAKLEVVKADTSFITWRHYSDILGFIPISQTVFDANYDMVLELGGYDPIIRAAQGAEDAAKHEYIGMTEST